MVNFNIIIVSSFIKRNSFIGVELMQNEYEITGKYIEDVFDGKKTD